MIDSHTHLMLCDGSEEELVDAALAAGVGRMLTIGMGAETNPVAVASAERHEAVFAAVGRHPNDATGFDEAAAEEIRRLGAHEKVRAIGETGLDFYRDSAAPEDQRRAFAAQIGIARELGMPIVIHARDPDGESANDGRHRIFPQEKFGAFASGISRLLGLLPGIACHRRNLVRGLAKPARDIVGRSFLTGPH